MDGCVTVVRARANSRGLLQRVRETLRQVKAEHVGVVLNAVRAQAGGYYGRSIVDYYKYQNGAMNGHRDWLATSDVPKLFLDAVPGSILVGRQRELVRSWPALSEVTVKGSHFVPEDSPHEIGRALADWILTLR